MTNRILITGSSGLVGSALVRALSCQGVDVVHLDIKAKGVAFGDVRDLHDVTGDARFELCLVEPLVWSSSVLTLGAGR